MPTDAIDDILSGMPTVSGGSASPIDDILNTMPATKSAKTTSPIDDILSGMSAQAAPAYLSDRPGPAQDFAGSIPGLPPTSAPPPPARPPLPTGLNRPQTAMTKLKTLVSPGSDVQQQPAGDSMNATLESSPPTPPLAYGGLVDTAVTAVREGAIGRALGLSTESAAERERHPDNPLLNLRAAVPDQPGVTRGAAEFATGVTTPENLLIMGATSGVGALESQLGRTGLSRLISLGFSSQMLWEAIRQSPQFADQVRRGDWASARETLTRIGLAAGMSALGVRHATSPETAPPVGVTPPGEAAATEAPIRSAEPTQPAPRGVPAPTADPIAQILAEMPAAGSPGGPLPAAPPVALTGIPAWARDSINQQNAVAERLGVADEIERLSAQGLTAKAVADRLGSKLGGDAQDRASLVRAVRAARGVPSQDNAAEFAAWQRQYQAGSAAVPPPEPAPGTPEVPSEPTPAAAQPMSPMGNTGERGSIPADILTAPPRAVEQFARQDIIPAAREVGAGLAQAWDALKQVGAPATRGPEAKTTALSMREHMADRQRAFDVAQAAMQPAQKAFSPIAGAATGGDASARTQIVQFIDRIERGEADPNPNMQQAAQVFRNLLDQRREAVQDVNPNALQNYIENYFPHIWKRPSQAKSVMEQIVQDYFGKRPMQGSKDFLKARSIPFFEEGIRRGLEPVSWNPVDLVTQRLISMDKFVMARRVFADLKDQGLLKFVAAGDRVPDGYRQIDDNIATVYGPRKGAVQLPDDAVHAVLPGEEMEEGGVRPEDVTVLGQRIMGKYYAPEPAARVINNHLSPGLRGSEIAGSAFRGWMGASNWLNQLQLGFSAFHAGFTSIDAITSKVALALEQVSHGDFGEAAVSAAKAPVAFLTQPFGIGDKLVKEWQQPGSQADAIGTLVDAMKAGGWRGKQDQVYATQITNKMLEAFRSGNVLGGAMRAPFAAVEQAARPVLEWLVPRQKAAVVADLVRYEMERNPDMTHDQLREVAARAVDSADNRMGQLAYDNLFWNKTAKDLAMASTRSVGWNLGTLRELGGGLLDLRKLATGNLTHRTAYVMALPAVTAAIGAAMQYLMTGKGPQQLLDYFFPQTGHLNERGVPDRLSIPSYMKDVYSYIEQPGRTLANKVSPLANLVADMLQNKDYYGTQIRNQDDPLVQQAMDIARFVGTNIEPFTARSMQREHQLGAPAAQYAPSFFGFQQAPAYLTQTPAERLAEQYREQNKPQGTRTSAEAAHTQARAQIVRAKRMGQDPQPLIDDARAKGLLAKGEGAKLKEDAKRTPLQAAVRSDDLSPAQALNVYATATPTERKQIEHLVRQKVKNASGKMWEWNPTARAQAKQFFGITPRQLAAEPPQPSDMTSPLDDEPLPRFGRGGIVRRPTVALIGEAGPEAIIPVRKLVASQAGRKIYRTLRAKQIDVANGQRAAPRPRVIWAKSLKDAIGA